MRRATLAAGLILALSLALTAPAGAAQKVTVGLSWNSKDVAIVQAWEDYLIKEGKRQGPPAGIELEWKINVADADPARQASNIEDLLNQNVDIVMARAEDAAAIGASVRAAKEAGVPFVTFDRASATTKPTAHVGGDSYKQAESTAAVFGDLLKAKGVKGECIELQGALTDVNAVNRSKAWNEHGKASGAYETVVQVPTDWKPELYLSGLTNALRAHPQANCVFAASDFAWNAIQSALEGANRYAPAGQPNHVWMATQDLFPPALPAMEQGYIDVSTTYDAFAHAQEAV